MMIMSSGLDAILHGSTDKYKCLNIHKQCEVNDDGDDYSSDVDDDDVDDDDTVIDNKSTSKLTYEILSLG